MIQVIIGNISSIGAMICDSYSGTRHTRRDILLVQTFSQVFYFISFMILKGYSAAVQNVIAIFRNFIAMKDEPSKKLAILLTTLPAVLGLILNNRGLMGLIPVFANLQYSIVIFKCPKNEKAIKLSLIINYLTFCVFNFYILNFVSGVACIISATTTAISLYASKKNKEA